jgi:hypothetical protein
VKNALSFSSLQGGFAIFSKTEKGRVDADALWLQIWPRLAGSLVVLFKNIAA